MEGINSFQYSRRKIPIKLKNMNDYATEEMQLQMLLKLVSAILLFFTK